MSKITLHFNNREDYGSVTFNAKHDEKFYLKKKLLYKTQITRSCDSSLILKHFRYINWSDKTGFLRAKSCTLQGLNHKRPTWSQLPLGFDHTSYWRRPNEMFPLLILTEPYHIDDKEIEGFNYISSDVLKYAIIKPSEKSLWVPNRTYMIFWWNPKYFDFDANIYSLLKHEDANLFEKKCNIEKIYKKE